MPEPTPLPVRVLLVEDEEAHYLITRTLLFAAERTAFELDWVRSYEEAREAVTHGGHDVYLVDYFLEDRTGLDLIREIQRSPRPRPVIMLTGKGDRAVDVEAMHAGAADYLVKGTIDPQVLERSIRYAMEAHQAREDLLLAEARSRRTFEHVPIGLFRLGPGGEFLAANPALRELLGYPDEALLNGGFARDLFVASEDAPALRDELARAGQVRDFDSEVRRVDGSTVAVRVTVWQYVNDDVVEYVEGTVQAGASRPHPSARTPAVSGAVRLP